MERVKNRIEEIGLGIYALVYCTEYLRKGAPHLSLSIATEEECEIGNLDSSPGPAMCLLSELRQVT